MTTTPTSAACADTLADDVRRFADFVAAHDHDEDIVIQKRVPGSTVAERLERLRLIAEDWGVRTGRGGKGVQIAERRFGHVRYVACVDPYVTERAAGTLEAQREIADERARIAALKAAAA